MPGVRRPQQPDMPELRDQGQHLHGGLPGLPPGNAPGGPVSNALISRSGQVPDELDQPPVFLLGVIDLHLPIAHLRGRDLFS